MNRVENVIVATVVAVLITAMATLFGVFLVEGFPYSLLVVAFGGFVGRKIYLHMESK